MKIALLTAVSNGVLASCDGFIFVLPVNNSSDLKTIMSLWDQVVKAKGATRKVVIESDIHDCAQSLSCEVTQVSAFKSAECQEVFVKMVRAVRAAADDHHEAIKSYHTKVDSLLLHHMNLLPSFDE